jgi:hypothetical protein
VPLCAVGYHALLGWRAGDTVTPPPVPADPESSAGESGQGTARSSPPDEC